MQAAHRHLSVPLCLIVLCSLAVCGLAANDIVLDKYNDGDTIASFHLEADSWQDGNVMAFIPFPDDAYCPIGATLPTTSGRQNYSDQTLQRYPLQLTLLPRFVSLAVVSHTM